MALPKTSRTWPRTAGVSFGAVAAMAAVLGLRFASARSAAPGASSSAPTPAKDLGQAVGPKGSAGRVALGRKIFFDTRLSEPQGTSCASCHDPARAFSGNHGSTVGVAIGSRPDHQAKRNTPSVLYLKFARRFRPHWEEDAPLVDMAGGLFWDGRVESLSELTKQPLLNPDEMNGGGAEQVAAKVRSGEYAEDFGREFAFAVGDPEATLKAVGEAVEAYLTSPEMAPFSSKYDDYVRGHATLSPLEARGLKLFKDSAKGGCATCHKLNDGVPNPERSLFTDYGFEALGVPRNRSLAANRDPSYFDLGLCQSPDTRYHTDTEQFCGSFRTPSLRNVAVRQSFMHNGYFSKLRDVVSFYATRATDPKRWYKYGTTFDDISEKYRRYVNVEKAPYNRHEGEVPSLDESDIDAIVSFLGTLTDAQFR
jgi:cytochrome c peroxidase